MGTVVSKAKLFLQASYQLNKTLELLKKKVNESPGLPVPNPTLPLWTVPAATIPGKDMPDGDLAERADVVVIGSGITGTSFAYNALSSQGTLRVVMLEARDVCSGATGRNGGHINPPLYHDYNDLKEKHGEEIAKSLIAFRRAHIVEMMRVASEEDILKESQVRETEHLDVYTCPIVFKEAKENLAKWREDMPLASSTFVCHEGSEALEKFHLSDDVVGCISNAGGAMHPYRFVTSLLSILLSRHPDNFQVYTRTPCTEITADKSGLYAVHTPRGRILTPHVVHATNGWSSNLLPNMRTKLVPVRGMMSAQRPGRALHPSTLSGQRSFVFYRGARGYDYLTQLPAGEHELMFGGGWASAITCDGSSALPDIGTDDARLNPAVQSYLAGALPQHFGLRNWGADAVPAAENDAEASAGWHPGRTKAQWSGVLGISADMFPWVGRLPEQVSGRAAGKRTNRPENERKGEKDEVQLAPAGEWIAAGYSGEGMVHAWMSGKALASMVLDREEEIVDWFPEILRVTEKRWKEANIEDLFAKFL